MTWQLNDGKIKTDFYSENIPKQGFRCVFISIIIFGPVC